MTLTPSGAVILGCYERGMTASPATRAAILADAGGAPPDATLGDADRATWQFLTTQFGAAQDAVLTCSACDEDVEFSLPPGFAPPPGAQADDRVDFTYQGQTYALRLPRLSDLGRAGFDPRRLCPDGDWADAGFRDACQAALLQADPALRLDMSLTCAACAAEQTHVFDVTGYAWARLEQAARALVRDVAKLARGYGWSEADITAMSSARRAIYLRELGE